MMTTIAVAALVSFIVSFAYGEIVVKKAVEELYMAAEETSDERYENGWTDGYDVGMKSAPHVSEIVKPKAKKSAKKISASGV